MKSTRFFLAIVTSFSTAAFADTVRATPCEETPYFSTTWDHLTRVEPKINQELGEIGHASGVTTPTVPMTNCRVDWPANEQGKMVDGYRTIVMDKVWYTDGGAKRYHRGMKIIFYEKSEDMITHVTIKREIQALAICRSSSTCEALDIPFKKPASDSKD